MNSVGVIGPNVPAGTSTPTAIVRNPYLLVEVNGQALPHVFSARCSFGFDIRVSEAQIVIPVISDLPKGAGYWASVKITMGATPFTARPRFAGYLVEFDYDLYPRAVTLICKGPLIKAQQTACPTSGGIDMSNGGAGDTDQNMIGAASTGILARCGLPFSGLGSVLISGTGKTLGTVATKYFKWNEGQSGQDFIDQLDAICTPDQLSGYRTFDSFDGSVVRKAISATPGNTPAFTFTEGVDIEKGSNQQAVLGIKNRMVVTGFDAGSGAKTYTVQQANPNLGSTSLYVTQQISSNLIEKALAADAGSGMSCEEVGNWQLGELNRTLWKAPFTTPRDDVIAPGATIAVVSTSRLGVDSGHPNMWVQHVDVEIDEQGQFSQTLTCLGGYGSSLPVDVPPQAGFTLTIEQELVIVAGVETALYTVHAISTSAAQSGSISSYAWTATGGTPSSGSEERFTTTYTSVSGKQITLVVTDSNGATNTVTYNVPTSSQVQYTLRRLYAAGSVSIDDFDGTQWRVATVTSGTVASNAPVWGAGDAYYSTDDLATVSHDTPFAGGATVASLWVETDINASNVLAGASDGHLAYSTNGAVSWTVVAGPDPGNAVIRCVASRSNAGQFFAMTVNGLWRTDNAGATWALVVAAAGGETFRDVNVSFSRIMIAMAGGRLLCDQTGTAQTFPVLGPVVSDVYAITADIAHDRFYCYDSLGRTFYHTADAGTTLARRTDLPGTPHPQPRGLWRDGAIRGLLYIAAGSDGCYKSVDGFNSSGGYYLIRKATIGTSPASANYSQIGANGLLVTGAITPTTEATVAAGEKVLNIGNVSGYTGPPTGWQDPGFSDSGWGNSANNDAAETGGGGTTIGGAAWVTYAAAVGTSVPGSQEFLLRKTFTPPAGTITSASLVYAVDADLLELYVNGLWVSGNDLNSHYASTNTVTIPTNLLLPGASNVLAMRLRNGSNTMTLMGTMGVIFKLSIS